MLKRLLALCFLFSMLAGCLHAQLNGSVAGASITVTPLRNASEPLAAAQSADETLNIALYGDAAWTSWNGVVRHWLLGIFTVDGTRIEADTLYLVTASGGFDTDMDRDLVADGEPTPVNHDWRAIMTGEQLLTAGYKVSAAG